MIRVIDDLQEGIELWRRLASDSQGSFGLIAAARIKISADDPDFFARQPDEPLDVIRRRTARKFEDDHVPAFRLRQVISKLADDDPVAAERAFIRMAA